MKSSKKSKAERLRSAAIVKLKYEFMTGKLDTGFETVYKGVLSDLAITEEEVLAYIEKNREELQKICLEEKKDT